MKYIVLYCIYHQPSKGQIARSVGVSLPNYLFCLVDTHLALRGEYIFLKGGNFMTCKPDNFDVISDFIDRLRQEINVRTGGCFFSWHKVYERFGENDIFERLKYIEGEISAYEHMNFVIDDLSDEFLARFPPT